MSSTKSWSVRYVFQISILLDGSEKRPHLVSGNTPNKPREKQAREAQGNADDGTSEERPARRTLAFHGKSSPSQKVLCLSLLNEYSQQSSCLHSRKYVVSFKKYTDLDPCFYLCFKASRRILQKAKLVRSPKSPKQLTSPKSKTVVAVTWEKSKEAALVQFIVLFGELKKGKWPTFGSKHNYWEKAANFIQETTRKNYKRSSKFFALLFSKIHPVVGYY